MHKSELSLVVDYLNNNAVNGMVNNIYRSFGGVLIKLFGTHTRYLFYSGDSGWLFPVFSVDLFPKEPIENRETALRKYLKGSKTIQFSLDDNYGKLVVMSGTRATVRFPLFAAALTVHTPDDETLLWQQSNKPLPTPLKKPLRFIEPRSLDIREYERLFLDEWQRLKQEELTKRDEAYKKRINRLMQHIRADIEKNEQNAQIYRNKATMISTHLYELPSRSRTASITVKNDDGEPLTIALDPSKTIVENMNEAFAKAKRAERGIERAKLRLEEVKRSASPTNRPSQPLPRQTATSKKKQPSHQPYHLFIAPNGNRFFVGKNAQDNDKLTFQLSSPHDYWFHVRGTQGSHIILAMPKGKTPIKEDILYGAMLAIEYSKAGNAKQAEVWYTQRKYIKKPKGAHPGKVFVLKGKTIFVKIDEAFLQNLKKQ